MDYKKAYEEALERMKSWMKGEHPECFTEAKKAAEFIFPELKESEDERIRKEMIEFFTFENWNGEAPFSPELAKERIAWLEKQGKDNMIEALRLEYEKGKADALQEQRKKWTSEDLLNRNEIMDILQECNRDDLIAWLEKHGNNPSSGTKTPKTASQK